MANFSIGTVKSDKQLAAAYIAYFMVGSYFKDVKIENRMLEQRMLMNYRLLSRKDQEEGEEKIDRAMRQMGEEYLKKIEDLRCVPHFKFLEDSKGKKNVCIWFETGFEEMLAIVDQTGNVSVKKH